jgi:protein involved in polysaccharide export with SLBB domain
MDSMSGEQKSKPSRRLISNLLFAFTLVWSAAGCGTAQVASEQEGTGGGANENTGGKAALKVRGHDEVAPGFEIKVSSLEDQNINGKFRIDFSGKLKLPYDVTLNTDGLTRDALKSKVNESYAKFFKSQPKIGVSVVEEKYWIDVRGLVEKPARVLVQRSASLDEALAQAGGLLKTATAKFVRIQQGEGSVTIKLSDYYSGNTQDKVPSWQGGDVVFFQSDRDLDEAAADGEKSYIQLLGEVKNPGEYRYSRKADFYDYLARAGGPSDKANLLKIEVIRNSSDGRTSSRFELVPKDIPQLYAGDMILVHSDKQTPSERVVAMAAGIAGILNTMLLIILLF